MPKKQPAAVRIQIRAVTIISLLVIAVPVGLSELFYTLTQAK